MKRLVVLLSGLAAFSLVQGLYAQSNQSATEIKVRLTDRLDTGKTQAGQTFTATVDEPVRLNHKTVLTRGTPVKGVVTDVVSSGRLKRPASITLQLDGLGSTAVRTAPLRLDGKSHAGRDTALIGGGTALGAIFGAIAGGGKGAAIGTAVGAGAGTGTAYATGKQEIVLQPETELTFVVAGSGPVASRPAPVEQRYTASSNPSESDRRDYDQGEDQQGQPGDPGGYTEPPPPPSEQHQHNVSVGIFIGSPPPAPVYVEPPPPPAPEFVWVEGYWYPVGNHYNWHEGYWSRPPYEGAVWVRPHYEGGDYFVGYWNGEHGRVEHDHHWDHDHDRDFHGHDNHEHDDHGHGNGHGRGHDGH